MKINLILVAIFVSFIAYSYSGLFERPTELLGGTELNGAGCVCHTVSRDTTVKVWIEGPDTLMVGQTGIYHMYLAGGPAQAGGYNVAGRFGTMVLTDSFSFWDYRSPNELTQAFPLIFPSTSDTIYWEFGYTASDSSSIDTLYSCGLSIVYDGIPDSLDRWNFGPKFPLTILQNTIPVELISFTAYAKKNDVELSWTTSTETNNRGFEIQRTVFLNEEKSSAWESVYFVNGNGTTTEIQNYSYCDKNLQPGKYFYRLKQFDFDGSYKYSEEVEVEIISPNKFALEQNYPNPFNPGTIIRWQSPVSSRQTIKLFDILGRELETIVDGYYEAGQHSTFYIINSSLPSGVYLYQLKVDNLTLTKKMVYLK